MPFPLLLYRPLRPSQERSAKLKGIPAVAIDQDTASHASLNEHRDLVNEVQHGKYGLVIVSPEMLTSERFKPLLADPKFGDHLCLVFVDECHLVEEHGMDFRPCYKEIGRLRHRLPSSVPWVAVSATLPNDQTFDKVMISLGFNPGNYIHDHLPIDNPHICYLPQFFQYPFTGTTFLDIAWLIPSTITSATNITKSLVFCNTINLGTRVYKFLQHLLPQTLSSDKVILPYHSLISNEGRLCAMERFRSGATRVIVASDCFTWGVDVPDIRQVSSVFLQVMSVPNTWQVIVFDLPSSFSKLVQQIGRAGRDKQQAYATTYAPPWVKDINKDPEELTKREAAELERRNKMCQPLRTWFNPTQVSCPREVFCLHFGDEPSYPENCCIKHGKNLPNMVPEPSRVEAFSTKWSRGQGLRSDGTHAPFTGPLRASITHMVSGWVQRAWDEVREENSLLPPTSFLSQELQNHLCERFHAITTVEHLSSVLAGWPHFEDYKAELFCFCQKVLSGLSDLRKETKEKQEIGSEGKHEMKEEYLAKIRIPPFVTSTENRTKKNEVGDGLEDEEPPKKKRCKEK
jgi:hypothetical protein